MNRSGPKGNRSKVEADAKRIVQELKAGTLLTELMRRYRCGRIVIMRVVRSHLTVEEWRRIRRRNQAKGGKANRFKKGHVPWSKGRKGLEVSPAAKLTQFKPGCIRGAAARKYKALGAITVRGDHPKRRCRPGRPKAACRRRFIKVKDWGRPQGRWMPYARWLWQRHRGAVPHGYIIIHADGDTMNDHPANLRLISRRNHLAYQQARNPEMAIKQHRKAALAAKKRWKLPRSIRDHAKRRSSLRRASWECRACGNAMNPDASDRCAKCGAYSFVKIRLPA